MRETLAGELDALETAQAVRRARALPQPWRRVLLLLLDCVGLGLSLFVAGMILKVSGWSPPSGLAAVWSVFAVFGGWILLYYLNRHYDTRVTHRRRADVAGFLKTTLLIALLASLVLGFFGGNHSTLWPLPLAGGCLFGVLGLLLRLLGWRVLADRRWKMPLLVMGSELAFRRVSEIVASQPWGPFLQPERVGTPNPSDDGPDNAMDDEALVGLDPAAGSSVAVVADEERTRVLPRQLDGRTGVRAVVWSLSEFAGQTARLIPVEALTEEWAHAHLAPPCAATLAAKRTLDLVLGSIFFLLALPLGLVISAFIELDAPGAVFYLQPRIGCRNRRLLVFKFRTMNQPRELSDSQWASVNDSRVTRFGRILRLYRLNELPQLLNVLWGNMSLVGPRPELPEFVHLLGRKIPCYSYRHLVKPGMTGWAQVNFHYGASVDEARIKLEYDLYYVKHCSVWFDIYILLRTIVIVLGGKGR